MVTKKQWNKFYNIIEELHNSNLVDIRISGTEIFSVKDGKITGKPREKMLLFGHIQNHLMIIQQLEICY